MAQFYTLEEAARVLGMDPEELKAKAQRRDIRAFLDSGTWRFKVTDIDELARRTGLGSDPELSLSDLEMPAQGQPGIYDSASEEYSEFDLGVARSDLGPKSMDLPAQGSISDADILLDDSILPLGSQSGSSSHILGMETGTSKLPSDSDVRLVPDGPKGASDSDVQLSGEVPIHPGKPSDSDVTLVQEGSGSYDALDAFEAGSDPSGETMLRPSPLGGGRAEGAGIEEDSDFELTPSSVIDALQPESGSDFELTALDGSDEFESTPKLRPSDSDVTGAEPATSGINLGKPSDSGINLQSVGGLDFHDADSIELAPLEDADHGAAAPPKAKAAPSAAPKPDPSATALPIKAEGQKDIFDDTDFEVDALELHNDDQTVQLESPSDFDLDESESASEVFAIDEEDVDQNAATAMGPAVLEEEDAVGAAMGEDVSGEMEGAGWEEDVVASTPSRPSPVQAAAGGGLLSAGSPGAEWGGLWVGFLSVATLLMLTLAFITMDVVRNLNGYEGDVPVASGLVKLISGLFG